MKSHRGDASRVIENPLNNVIGLILIIASISILFYFTLPPAIDWQTAFRPAAKKLLSGDSPYHIDKFMNPPWTLVPLLPFAILPENVGRAILTALALLTYAYVAYKLGADIKAIIFLLLSPPVIHSLLNGSLDWLVVLGFILPVRYGLFLVSMKPQVGLAVVVYWFVSSYREEGLKRAVFDFLPFTVTLFLSFMIFGFWPLQYVGSFKPAWNASLWPLSLPVGITLLYAALKRDKFEYAVAASPLLSPYVAFHSWVSVLLALCSQTGYIITSVIGLWLAVLIQY